MGAVGAVGALSLGAGNSLYTSAPLRVGAASDTVSLYAGVNHLRASASLDSVYAANKLQVTAGNAFSLYGPTAWRCLRAAAPSPTRACYSWPAAALPPPPVSPAWRSSLTPICC